MQRFATMSRKWSKAALRRLIGEKMEGKPYRLAKAIGVQPSTAKRWTDDGDSRTPDADNMAAIADALGVPLDALYEGAAPAHAGSEAARLMAQLGSEDQAAALHLLRAMASRGAAPMPRPGQPLNDLGDPTATAPAVVPAAQPQPRRAQPRRHS